METLKTEKTEHELFLDNPENRRLYEQERLLVEVTESLTDAMREKKVNRAQLAQALGRSKAFVTQLLRGNHNMTLRTLADLFNALEYQICLKAVPRGEERLATHGAVFHYAPTWYYESGVGNFLICGHQGTRLPQPWVSENLLTNSERAEMTFSNEVAA
jgi:transcriptional regulator with XRE-family HTH domain